MINNTHPLEPFCSTLTPMDYNQALQDIKELILKISTQIEGVENQKIIYTLISEIQALKKERQITPPLK